MSLPFIRFVKIIGGRQLIEVDGTTVGEFIQSQQFHNQAEQFKFTLENLKHTVSDDVVDTFKFIDSLQQRCGD